MDDNKEANEAADTSRPYMPIAVGFYLLALPFFVAAVFLSDTDAVLYTNISAGGVMAALGVMLHWRAS